jgi:hypothetical protein
VAIHYGGERGSFSQEAWDVRVGDEFPQIKALRNTGKRTRRSLSSIRSERWLRGGHRRRLHERPARGGSDPDSARACQ